jgi:hypothetical protein
VLTVGQHHPSDGDLVHLADGFAGDGEGVVTDLSVRHQVVGSDQIPRVDLAAVDELVNLDGSRRFQRDVLEFLCVLGRASLLCFGTEMQGLSPVSRIVAAGYAVRESRHAAR